MLLSLLLFLYTAFKKTLKKILFYIKVSIEKSKINLNRKETIVLLIIPNKGKKMKRQIWNEMKVHFNAPEVPALRISVPA